MWRVDFVESGGYDCMTDAFYFYRGDARAMSHIDVARFGQTAQSSEDETLAAKTLAQVIVDEVLGRLNGVTDAA